MLRIILWILDPRRAYTAEKLFFRALLQICAMMKGRLRVPIYRDGVLFRFQRLGVRGMENGSLYMAQQCITSSMLIFPIPLGTFTCVTGVSGSGKSSFVNEILYKKLASELNGAKTRAGAFDSIEGMEYLDKVIDIDQSPIGRTPRSNPATYTGVFHDIRELFASTQDAKLRGYSAGHFPSRCGERGALRGLCRRWTAQNRNAFFAGYLCALRCV